MRIQSSQILVPIHESQYMFWFGCSRQQKRHAVAPPPARVRRRMERNRQKTVGRDKGSLTEQQTKGTATTTIQKRGIHKTNQQNRARRIQPLSRTAPPLCAPEPREFPPPSSPPPEPSVTAHVWPGGVSPASRLCPFLDFGEN